MCKSRLDHLINQLQRSMERRRPTMAWLKIDREKRAQFKEILDANACLGDGNVDDLNTFSDEMMHTIVKAKGTYIQQLAKESKRELVINRASEFEYALLSDLMAKFESTLFELGCTVASHDRASSSHADKPSDDVDSEHKAKRAKKSSDVADVPVTRIPLPPDSPNSDTTLE